MLGSLPSCGQVVERDNGSAIWIAVSRAHDRVTGMFKSGLKHLRRNAGKDRAVKFRPLAICLKRPLQRFIDDPTSLQIRIAQSPAQNGPAIGCRAVDHNSHEWPMAFSCFRSIVVPMSQMDTNLTQVGVVSNSAPRHTPHRQLQKWNLIAAVAPFDFGEL